LGNAQDFCRFFTQDVILCLLGDALQVTFNKILYCRWRQPEARRTLDIFLSLIRRQSDTEELCLLVFQRLLFLDQSNLVIRNLLQLFFPLSIR